MNDAEDRPPSARLGSVSVDLSASSASDERIAHALAPLINKAIAALASETPLHGEVRVRLVRDAEMAALHERHSGISGTTDVLTFDLREDPTDAAAPIDADLILCIDEADRQAASRSIPLAHELTLYVVHGLLHVLGHDDHDDDAYSVMHAREDRILSAAGLGPVFSAPEATETAP